MFWICDLFVVAWEGDKCVEGGSREVIDWFKHWALQGWKDHRRFR